MPGDDGDAASWFDTGLRALTDATRPPAGPVHVNCCFEEPTVPDGEATWSRRDAPAVPEVEHDPDAIGAALDSFVASYAGRRGVITIGALRPPQTLSLLSLGALLGWPVLAEPLSGLRLDASDAGRALAAGQLLLGDDAWLARHRPEVVLQVGATPTTRASQRLVAAAGALVVLDRDHLDPDPNGLAERRIAVDPEAFAAQAWDRRDELTWTPPEGWSSEWRTSDLRAHAVVDRLLDGWAEPFEGRIARDVGAFVPHGGALWVGSSMPVRDLDAYLAPRRPPRIWNPGDLIRVMGNRGASGIDGSVATILGVAAANAGPTYALLGDLSSCRCRVLAVVGRGGSRCRHGGDREPRRADLLDARPARACRSSTSCSSRRTRRISPTCAARPAVGHQLVDRSRDLVPALERAARDGGAQVIEVAAEPDIQHRRRAEVRDAVAATLARTD